MKKANNKKTRTATGQTTYLEISLKTKEKETPAYYSITVIETTKSYIITDNATITSNGKGVTLHYLNHFQKPASVYLSPAEWDIEY